MKEIILTGSCLMVLLSGCGGDNEDTAIDSPAQVETLSVACEIGEMMGDSSYVFGEIASAVPTAGGGVAVLDIYGCDISFFDSSGSFIRSIGGRGEGPGEFLLPLDFAILDDGRIAVIDLVNRRIDILSESGELLNSLETGYAMLPFKMSAVADSSFMIYYYSTRLSGDSFDMGFNLEIWDTSGFQLEIWSWRSEYTGADFIFSPGYTACCAGNGSIFISAMDNTEFHIDFLNVSDGSSGFITREAVIVEADSTDAGYIEPKVYVYYESENAPVDLESEPLFYRPQIGSMGVDGTGCLWVRQGTTDEEDWLLYSPEGEFICMGRITGMPEEGRLEYAINRHGAVAWAPFTEEHPRVFL
ncbi:hypothetical protein DRQ25_09200, partial [Candidatus Fermentibacteria bacterium]